jgi:glycosyltransferase involved in cell wall biosynthesis
MARTIGGFSVLVSGRPRMPGTPRRLLRYVGGCRRAIGALTKEIQGFSADIVWVNSLMNPLAAKAARRAGVPAVWHLHEFNFPGLLGRAAIGWMRRQTRHFVAISEFVAGTFDHVRGNEMHVIHNPLLSPISVTRDRCERFTIGFIGQLKPRKRAEDVVQATARLPNTQAFLLGDGRSRGAVERLCRETETDERVRILGFTEIGEWLGRFDCLVIPSRDEPFGLVALEGMAAGVPIVAAKSGALPEVLDRAALFYPLGDVDSLVQQIDRIRAEPELCEDLVQRGFRRIAQFLPERWVREAEAVAQEAIDAAGRDRHLKDRT